jgi:hypothetical protein
MSIISLKATPRENHRGSSPHQGKKKDGATSERRNRSKSANLQGIDLTSILDGSDGSECVSLTSIAETATVSHTDITVLQQAGFFNSNQGSLRISVYFELFNCTHSLALAIWKYLATGILRSFFCNRLQLNSSHISLNFNLLLSSLNY